MPKSLLAHLGSALFDAPFPVTAAGCGPVSARRETGSLELDAWVEYSVILARFEQEDGA